MNIRGTVAGLVACVVLSTHAARAEINVDIDGLQQRWAEVNYQLQGSARLSAFEQLLEDVQGALEQHSDQAAIWLWNGIIKSSYAKAKGGLSALELVKQSKEDLERAMGLDADVMQGLAYAALGTLYFNVPEWPLGFKDEKKAEELFQRALLLNPDGVDSNYFYGRYLVHKKRYAQARHYLEKARQEVSKDHGSVAGIGRQQEIAEALTAISAN
ncbi:MAG: hypothetical protein RQ899_00620 [Pseudomonadales bacterium]|nr:hypothetical protein [Pseudomonadales bacterium]